MHVAEIWRDPWKSMAGGQLGATELGCYGRMCVGDAVEID